MTKSDYSKMYLREVLKKHGYEPKVFDAGWIQLALTLVIVEKLDKVIAETKKI